MHSGDDLSSMGVDVIGQGVDVTKTLGAQGPQDQVQPSGRKATSLWWRPVLSFGLTGKDRLLQQLISIGSSHDGLSEGIDSIRRQKLRIQAGGNDARRNLGRCHNRFFCRIDRICAFLRSGEVGANPWILNLSS